MIASLVCAAALLVGQSAGRNGSPAAASAGAPNVLLIVLDDVGVDQLGSYAVDYPTLPLVPCTPNLDALAAAGVRFTNAWSNPVCSPTRAQILTGKPALRTGVGAITFRGKNVPGNHGLQPFEDTLATILPSYESVFVGKWHVSDPEQDWTDFKHTLRLGFERFAGNLYGLDPDYDDWTKTLTPPGVQIQHFNGYATTDTTGDALVELATMQEPWLLEVAFNAAHSPFHCPGDLGYNVGPLAGDPCPTSWGFDCAGMLGAPPCTTYGPEACRARAMVHSMDHEIGKLLAAVDLNTTAVFVIGDNGTPKEPSVAPFTSAHAKGSVYQGGINVPLIVRVPGGTRGVSHELISATDLFATIAELTGTHVPPHPDRDSLSFLQLLRPGVVDQVRRELVYAEYFSPNFKPVAGAPPAAYKARIHMRAVRNERYKLIEIKGEDPLTKQCVDVLEFYHLADAPPQNPAFGPDPFELNDLMPSMATWNLEQQQNFAALGFALSVTYPQLPTICP